MPSDTLEPSLAAKVAFLTRPDAYADAGATVDVIETHMSWLFLTAHHVYKLKKPIGNHLMDFSTPAARHRNAVEEVRLNRRLAPDVYLGVVPLTFTAAAGFRLGGDGGAVDWLVQMRRLPAAQMLDQRLRAQPPSAAEIAAIAQLLAAFYARAPAVEMSGPAYLARLGQAVAINRGELRAPLYRLDAARIDALCDRQLEFLRRRAELPARRAAESRIIEAHGDLRPEHICVAPPPVAIDCLEFNRALRLLDPADELAYLALECELLAPAPAARIEAALFGHYRRRCADRPAPALVHFYKSLRAAVRARLMALHLRDHPQAQWPRWLAKTETYLALAEKYGALLLQ